MDKVFLFAGNWVCGRLPTALQHGGLTESVRLTYGTHNKKVTKEKKNTHTHTLKPDPKKK